jgi:hypothetical protein
MPYSKFDLPKADKRLLASGEFDVPILFVLTAAKD